MNKLQHKLWPVKTRKHVVFIKMFSLKLKKCLTPIMEKRSLKYRSRRGDSRRSVSRMHQQKGSRNVERRRLL